MNNTLNENKLVKRSIRPPRIAFIVETGQDCETFIKRASFIWGGKNFLPIPLQNNFIDDAWLDILNAYLPDYILSFKKLDAKVSERLSQINNRQITVLPIENPTNYIWGLSTLDVLSATGVLDDRNKLPKFFYPQFQKSEELESLYTKARYGVLDINDYWQQLVIYERQDWKKELHEIIPLNSVQTTKKFVDYLIQDEYIDSKEAIPVIDYSLWGLQFEYSSDLAGAQHVFPNLIIVTRGDPVSDFCFYWMMKRQASHFQQIAPTWLPLEEFQSNIEKLGNNKRPIASTSIPAADLSALIKAYGEKYQVVDGAVDELYDPRYYMGIIDDAVVSFHNNKARIPVPESKIINSIYSTRYCFLDITIPGIHLPDVNTSSWRSKKRFTLKPIFYKINQQRLTFVLRVYQPSHIETSLPTGWEIAETVADEAGFEIELSDRGRIAERLLEIIGGIDNIWFFTDTNIINLIEEMSEVYQAKEFKSRLKNAGIGKNKIEDVLDSLTTDHHDRVMRSEGDIRNSVGLGKETKNLLQWLLDNFLLERGTELKCYHCYTKQWLSINEFQTIIKCKGCLNQISIPLKTDQTMWQYRLNTLFARAYDLGIFPHLLTAFYLMDTQASILWENSFLGNFYGVLFSNIQDPNKKREADLLLISDGKIVIGECKKNAYELDQKSVDKTTELGLAINCDEILYGVLDARNNLHKEVLDKIDQSPIPSRIVCEDELLNRYMGRAWNERWNEQKKGNSERLPAFKELLISYFKDYEPKTNYKVD